MTRRVKVKTWMRKHVKAGLIPGFHSKHTRQRQVAKPSEVRDLVDRRHKRGRKVTEYERGKLVDPQPANTTPDAIEE